MILTDRETRVKPELVRRLKSDRNRSSDRERSRDRDSDTGGDDEFGEGMKVEARFKGRSRWFPATIKFIRRDGTMDLLYDDGGVSVV